MASELNHDGQRAYAIAVDKVGDGQYHFAVERYARAVDMSSRLWSEWVDLGRPILLEAPNGVPYAHPLMKLYREWAAEAASAAKAVLLDPSQVKGRPGRPVGAASSADRVMGPMIEVNATRSTDEPPKVEWRGKPARKL